jgi:hypothetical protein
MRQEYLGRQRAERAAAARAKADKESQAGAMEMLFGVPAGSEYIHEAHPTSPQIADFNAQLWLPCKVEADLADCETADLPDIVGRQASSPLRTF